MKISKKQLIILIASLSVLVLTAIVVGVLCVVLLPKEKPLTVSLQRKVAIVYEDEKDLKINELFGVQVITKEDYWILYDGYDTNILSIGMDGTIQTYATGTTNIVLKVCTKSKTLPYVLSLHIVSKGYASNVNFEHATIYFSYLETVTNRLTIETLNNGNYLYPIDVVSSHDTITYDAYTGKLSYVGNKLSNTEYLMTTITCKVRKDADEYIEKSFVAYVDFTKYATHLFIQNQDVDHFTYHVHANDSIELDVTGVNQYEEGKTDVPVEYTVISRPEGAEGNEIDGDTLCFQAGSKLGSYQILAKAASGIDKLGRPTYVTGIFTIEVMESLSLNDCQVKVLKEGKEVSPNLLYVGENYQFVIECDKKKLLARNLMDIATPNHMNIGDSNEQLNSIYINFLFDQAGEYTFLASYLDKCDSGKHAIINFVCNFKVFDHASTTISFRKGDRVVLPDCQTLTIPLYDKNEEEAANKDGYYDTITISLKKAGMSIDAFDVMVENTNIAYYDTRLRTLVGLQCGQTKVTIKDPTTSQTWTYDLVVENVLGSIEHLGNVTLYVGNTGDLALEYPNELCVPYWITPIYAVKDWAYDDKIIELVIMDDTLSIKAKSVGKTSLILGGVSYATISVIEYAGQEKYSIDLYDGDKVIDKICGKGNDRYDLVVSKNGQKVQASIRLEGIGIYAFLLNDEVYLKYEESGTLTIYATVEGVTLTKEIQVKREE